jgi:hypothetical protein
MKCIYPNCTSENIISRYLCQKHFDSVKYRKQLENYPRMKRQDGTGCITNGYKKLTINGKRIFEHRYIIEKSLGRKLEPSEKIHHIDGNSLNNSLNNLIVTSQSSHITRFHNNKPRVFDWNEFVPENKNNKCQVCNLKTRKKIGLCRKHYDTYYHWKQRH